MDVYNLHSYHFLYPPAHRKVIFNGRMPVTVKVSELLHLMCFGYNLFCLSHTKEDKMVSFQNRIIVFLTGGMSLRRRDAHMNGVDFGCREPGGM